MAIEFLYHVMWVRIMFYFTKKGVGDGRSIPPHPSLDNTSESTFRTLPRRKFAGDSRQSTCQVSLRW